MPATDFTYYIGYPEDVVTMNTCAVTSDLSTIDQGYCGSLLGAINDKNSGDVVTQAIPDHTDPLVHTNWLTSIWGEPDFAIFTNANIDADYDLEIVLRYYKGVTA